MVEGTPCEVVEIIARTGMAGEASQVKIRVLDGIEQFVETSPGITLQGPIVREIFREIIDHTVDLQVEFLIRNYAREQ